MEVFRLHNKKYPVQLSGEGAAKFGARWNSKGTEVIYAAHSRALALAEVVVHLSLSNLPKKFCMLTILIPDDLEVLELNVLELDEDWNSFPDPVATQKIGDSFIQNKRSCVLKIPSAVVKGDFNFMINPNHKDFERINISSQEDFPIDNRLFKS